MILTLVTVPLYLKALGDAKYGILVLVWLVIGYFSFMELGLGRATAHKIAKKYGDHARERAEIFWTSVILNLTLGVIGAALIWILADHLILLFSSQYESFQEDVKIALPWVASTFPLALLSSILYGALEGRNKFLLVNTLQLITTVFFQLIPLIIMYRYEASLALVIPAAVITKALMTVPCLVACMIYVPATSTPVFSPKQGKSLLSYGGFTALSGLLGMLIETIDRMLIGFISGPVAVTHYSVPYQAVTKIRIIPSALMRALFPKLSRVDGDFARKLSTTSLFVIIFFMTPVCCCIILVLNAFLRIWVGEDMAKSASSIGEIIAAGLWANSLSQVAVYFLLGQSKPGMVAKIHLMQLVPFVIIMYACLSWYGIYGAACAWAGRCFIDAAVFLYKTNLYRAITTHLLTPISMITFSLILARYNVEGGAYQTIIFLTMGCLWFLTWCFLNRKSEVIRMLLSTITSFISRKAEA
ncbi:MAG: hypothetical protein DRR42_26065 [Gammaproteobacteria bacterium]|nr:MAG: hypothetical protein DRR42_26065 [Gammaproteobacteria bacterium]